MTLAARFFLSVAIIFASGAADARHGYRPALGGLGTPCDGPVIVGCDFATGRTSTNPLKIAIISTTAPITGVSTTSVTVATGTKVFTVDLSKGSYDAGDQIIIASEADSAGQRMTGTVTSLVGTTLTLNITSKTGAATASDWQIVHHLPSGWLEITSIRARTGDAIDWDFRRVGSLIRVDGSTTIAIRQSIHSACNWVQENNNVFNGATTGGAGYTVHNFEFDGCGYDGRIGAVFGGVAPHVMEYVRVVRAPNDIALISGSALIPTFVWRYNYLQSHCTTARSYGLHSDIFQSEFWDAGNLEIHNNVMKIECTNFPLGSSFTGPFNLNMGAAFTGSIYAHDNIAHGGAYTVFQSNANCPCSSGTLRYENIYIAYPAFQSDINGNGGFLYNSLPAQANLTITNVRSSIANQSLNFRWNNNGSSTVVTQVP